MFGTDIMFDNPISISGCDVRSLAFCELLCINTQGLVECLQPYPVFSEKFQKEFPNDLTYNLREGHEDIHVRLPRSSSSSSININHHQSLSTTTTTIIIISFIYHQLIINKSSVDHHLLYRLGLFG